MPSLQSGAVDAIIAGMSPTEDRKAAIDFTENYYTSDFVVVVKKAEPMKRQLNWQISKVRKLRLN